MSTIITRSGKGSPLTNAEMDSNLTNLNTDKVEGQASSVDSEIALFSGTGGKTIKRASTTGILKATSGVLGAATAGTDIVVPGTATNFTKPQRPSLSSETTPSSNTVTWDLTSDSEFRINLNANITTFNLTGTLSTYAGYQYQVGVRYNGGTTITWPATVKWPAGTAPTLTGTSGKLDIFTFVILSNDGGTTFYLYNTGSSQNL